MTKDIVFGVVGAGLMGRGIAQIAISCGVTVRLHDNREDAALQARESVGATLDMLVKKGRLTPKNATAALERLQVAPALADLASCTVVIEAIVEKMDSKQELFRALEEIVADDCILASNTSSLSVTEIAAGCRRPSMIAGMHFFSPVPLMKIVEVIGGPLTSEAVVIALMELGARMGHTAIRVSDSPGFLVNHAGRGYLTEALRTLSERVTDYSEIDRILCEAAGFRLGPFELLDLTGLDVSQPVMESIYTQYYEEPRFRPSPLVRQRLAAGLLGRKTQQGFYRYIDGKKVSLPAQIIPPRDDVPVWLSSSDALAFPEVPLLLGRLGADLDNGVRPGADSLCVVLPVGDDASTLATSNHLDAARTVALDPLFLHGCRTVTTTPGTTKRYRDAAHAIFAGDGVAVTIISDSAGCVAQRVIATIVNIACDIAQQGIASPDDIDRAVVLGLGYRQGPLAMGDGLGTLTVLRILDAMFAIYRDPRYRPSPWLRRRAQLGLSLLTVEH